VWVVYHVSVAEQVYIFFGLWRQVGTETLSGTREGCTFSICAGESCSTIFYIVSNILVQGQPKD
jgi:hypothetical protein